MKKVRFGVIGCGNVSPTYLYTLGENPRSEVVWVADTDVEKARGRARTFGIKGVFDSYQKALKTEKPDAVVVCSPHYAHLEQALTCAEKGIDILCEKPLATNLDDVSKILDGTKDVKFGVMLQRRFYQNTIQTAGVLRNGDLGEIENVTLEFKCNKDPDFYNTWRGKEISGGGVMLSQALHRIDQLVYFFGKPLEVAGETRVTRDYIEVEDYAKGHVLFEGGIRVAISADNSDETTSGETISLISIRGSRGEILLSDDKTLRWNVAGMQKPLEENILAIPLEFRPAYYGPCHEKVIDDFVDSIVMDRELVVSGVDSLDAMKIIFGFYESAREGRAVVKIK